MKIACVEVTRRRRRAWSVFGTDRGSVALIEGALRDWAPRLLADGDRLLDLAGTVLPLDEVRLLAPLEDRARILGVGANYLSHLEKLGLDRPSAPVAYIKADSAMIGPGDTVSYPKICTQLDFEVELVAVVGRPMTADPEPTANLLGYTVATTSATVPPAIRPSADSICSA